MNRNIRAVSGLMVFAAVIAILAFQSLRGVELSRIERQLIAEVRSLDELESGQSSENLSAQFGFSRQEYRELVGLLSGLDTVELNHPRNEASWYLKPKSNSAVDELRLTLTRVQGDQVVYIKATTSGRGRVPWNVSVNLTSAGLEDWFWSTEASEPFASP